MAAEFLQKKDLSSKKVNELYWKSRSSFTIRAHHLVHYTALTQTESPQEYADYLVFKISKGNYSLSYKKDILGEVQKEIEKYKKDSENTFKTFLSLPDKHPVKIIEGQQDIMCKNCIIGSHCRNYANLYIDRHFMNQFLGLSEEKNLSVKRTLVDFSNVPPQEVRTVKTTAKNVKDIISIPSWLYI